MRTSLALGRVAVIATILAGAALGSASAPARALDLLPPVAIGDSLATRHDRIRIVPPPGVLGNDLDLDGGTKAILVSGASHGTVTLRSDGGYTYVPAAGFVGTDQFRYRASSGLLDSLVTPVSIDVTNARPSARADAYTLDEGTSLNVPASGVLANDSDSDGDALSAELVTGPNHGSLSLASSGGFSYKPALGYAGSDSFSYRALDGPSSSAPTTVTLAVVAAPTPTPRPTPVPTAVPTKPPSPPPTAAPTPFPTVARTPGSTPRPSAPGGPVAPATQSPTSAPIRSSATPVPRTPGPPHLQSNRPSESERPAAVLAPTAPTGGGGGTSSPPAIDVQRVRIEVGDAILGDFDVLTGVDWAVPALVLALPGFVLILTLLAQGFVGALWLGFSRRRMRGLGVRSASRA